LCSWLGITDWGSGFVVGLASDLNAEAGRRRAAESLGEATPT